MLYQFFLKLGKIAPWLLLFIIPAFLLIYWINSSMLAAYSPRSTEEVTFVVAPLWDLMRLSQELENKKIVRNGVSIRWFGGLRKLQITAGEYSLSPGLKPRDVIDRLMKGERVKHGLTLTPCMTVDEVIKLIGQSALVSEKEAADSLHDAQLMINLGLRKPVPEGYLMAGSYDFSRPINPRQIVQTLVEGAKKKLEEAVPELNSRAAELGFTPYDILTLASIVEKESPTPELRPRLASVYHNRLRIGMPLQSDQALLYGMPNHHGEITQVEINQPGPYNTYLNTSLPPTPICSPEIDAIRAVLNPEDSDFLHISRLADGGLEFSATFKQHQEKMKRPPNPAITSPAPAAARGKKNNQADATIKDILEDNSK